MANAPPARSSFLRVSLRELLLAFGFAAVACAALKYASETWWLILSSCAVVLLLTAVVLSLVDRGRRQAMAMGFVACMAIYGLLLWSSPIDPRDNVSRELDGDGGERLPTTKFLKRLHEAIAVNAYFNIDTGEIIGNYGTNDEPELRGGLYVVGMNVRLAESPGLYHFMPIGHLLWAMLLGYLGARFAGRVYARRINRGTAE